MNKGDPSPSVIAFLALGSNQGDRAANLCRACHLLETTSGITIEARSPIYETESVEGGGEGNFLNAVLRVATSLRPPQLLQAARRVEETMGRPQPPRSGPRTIDIDVLLYDELQWQSPELILPHPRMWRRSFVLKPLCDVLGGGWVRPTDLKWEGSDPQKEM